MSQRVLFSRVSVFDVLENQKRGLRDHIQQLTASELENADAPQQLASQYTMNVPVLDEASKYATEKSNNIDVSRDPNRRYFYTHSGPHFLPGTELSIFMPFKGDPAVFDVRPSSFDLNPPVGDVIGNELCFIYKFVNAPTNLTGEYDQTIAKVKKYLDWLRPTAEQLERELQQAAQGSIDQRKQQTAERAQALASIGIPLRTPTQSQRIPERARVGAPVSNERHKTRRGQKDVWDIFVSHASEDKDEIARPLANALKAKGLGVWYDEFSLRVGDSLRESIDHGLLRSKFGVVILSPNFFAKHWPQQELNGLATRELDGKKVILPVWHNVGFEGVQQYSPMLADRVAVLTDQGLENVVNELMKAVW